MSALSNPGQQWRGQTRKWFFSQKATTVNRLKSIIQQYGRGTRPPLAARSFKSAFFDEAVVILDAFQPPLQDNWVQQLFRATPLMPPPAGPTVVHAPPPGPTQPQLAPLAPAPAPASATAPAPAPVLHPLVPVAGPRTTEPLLQLEPGSSDPIRIAANGLVAGSNGDFSRTLPGPQNLSAVNRIAAVRTTSPGDIYDFGQIYPYRGRGPIWSANSCSLDCCIVAARLLNVGITVADKGSAQTHAAWLASLSAEIRGFIDLVTTTDWETMPAQENIDLRHRFIRDIVFPALNRQWQEGGRFLPAAVVWEHFTKGVGQFEFTTSTRVECHTCNAKYLQDASTAGSITGLLTLSRVRLAPNAPKPSMENLLNRQFSARPPDAMDNQLPYRSCRRCNATISTSKRFVVHGSLPLRLVVAPDTSYADIVGATSSVIKVRYSTHDDQERLATYRWLGGIYNASNHFRLYWTDCSASDRSGSVKIYDGMRLSGAIIGEIPPAGGVTRERGPMIEDVPSAGDVVGSTVAINPNDRVPKYWSNSATLLYYERTSDISIQSEVSDVQPPGPRTSVDTSANPSTPQHGPQGGPGGSAVGNTGQNSNGANLSRGDQTAIDLTGDETGELPGQKTATPGVANDNHLNVQGSKLKRKASITNLDNPSRVKKTRLDTTEIQTTTERSIRRSSYAKAQKQLQDQQALLATTLPKIKKESIDLTTSVLQPTTTHTTPQAQLQNDLAQAPPTEESKQPQPQPHHIHESETEHQHYQSLLQTSISTPDLPTSSNSLSATSSQSRVSGFLAEEIPPQEFESEIRNESQMDTRPLKPEWLARTSYQNADFPISSNGFSTPSYNVSTSSGGSGSGFLAEEVTMEEFEDQLREEERLLDGVVEKVEQVKGMFEF